MEFLCSPCLVNVLIRRTSFVTSVLNLPQSRRENLLPLLRRRRMNDILAVKLGIRTNWSPHSCCSRCSQYLRCWLIGTHQSVPFAVRVVWREQKDHFNDCYFCFTKIDGHNSEATHNVGYPNIPSALRPVEATSTMDRA